MEGSVIDGIADLNLSPPVVKGELRAAYFSLSAHGLLHSAKWVAEQAAGIGPGIKAVMPVQSSEDMEGDEEDATMLGKSFFDVREYRLYFDYTGSFFHLAYCETSFNIVSRLMDTTLHCRRAAHVLEGCESHRAVFLRGYSKVLCGLSCD
jgi:hypothetical protein